MQIESKESGTTEKVCAGRTSTEIQSEDFMTANQVADFFIRQADAASGDVVTHLKLQKLLYYAQGWHLALFDENLFPERIEAWAHGPVCPPVWARFKDQNFNPITPDDIHCENVDLSEAQQNFLEEVWRVYGQFSAKRLEEMTHGEPPYLDARGNIPEYARSSEVISPSSMKEYFRSLKK
jgi:uncharacterized phage-associated protein